MAIRSAHSLVEELGPPPPAASDADRSSIGALIRRMFPAAEEANIVLEFEAMLFDDTTLSGAPEAAAHHPNSARGRTP